jgi:hypothetical protein
MLTSSSFLPVTYILRFGFPLITCFRRQFLRKTWPIQLAFLLFIVCRIFLSSLTLCNTSSFLTRPVQLIFSILLQHQVSKVASYFWSTFERMTGVYRVINLSDNKHYFSSLIILRVDMQWSARRSSNLPWIGVQGDATQLSARHLKQVHADTCHV